MHQSTTCLPASWARIALATFALTILAACDVRETGQVPTSTSSLPATPPTRTTVPFEATLQADKATAMAGFEGAMATAGTEPTPEVWPTLPPNPTYDPNRSPRGFVSCEPRSIDQVLIENCWVEEINGVRVGVRAGALMTDPEQGALQIRDEVYLTPTRSGRARLVQADGLVLTVGTANGDFFSFDVAMLQWGAPQPTATPRPLEDYPQGMIACANSPTIFLAGNCWALLLGDRYYQLSAGANQDEPLQGYLIVTCQNIQPGGTGCERRRYDTPSQVGRVEIVQANGAVLILQAENNELFAFDLVRRNWVTPLATPTPVSATATPTATPTSTPSPTPVVTNAAVRPVLECVVDNGGGAYTAYFGYKNDNTGEVPVPVGPNNRFSPAPQDRS